VRNSGDVSRYLTSLEVRLDGDPVDPAAMRLRNPTVGEAGAPVPVAELGPEAGFYVRRQQQAELTLPASVEPGRHRVELRVGLAGVAEQRLDEVVPFAEAAP
jgi:hypothetical protein